MPAARGDLPRIAWHEQITQVSEAEIAELHGMGRKTLGRLRQALDARGLSFTGDD